MNQFSVRLALKRQRSDVSTDSVDFLVWADSAGTAEELVTGSVIESVKPFETPKPKDVIAETLIGVGPCHGAARISFHFPTMVVLGDDGTRWCVDHVDSYFKPEHIPGVIRMLRLTLRQLTSSNPEGTK